MDYNRNDPDLRPSAAHRPADINFPAPDPTDYLQTTPPKMPLAKKLAIALGSLLAIMLVGAAIWLVVNYINSDHGDNAANLADNTKEESPKPLKPATLAYFTRSQQPDEASQCAVTSSQLSWQTVSEPGDPQPANMKGQDQSTVGRIDESGVFKDKVFVITYPQCDPSGNPAVWYSSDAGKNYAKVYDFKEMRGSEEYPASITSAHFSSDGKTIIVGYLPSAGENNIVMEVDPDAESIKELFGVDRPGVFLQAYDRESGQALYYKGCYNCDSLGFNKLYRYDIESSSESIVLSDPGYLGFRTVINNDLDQMLRIKQVMQGPASENTTYVLEFSNLTEGTSQHLLTADSRIVAAGFLGGDGAIYYAQNDGVYVSGEDGKSKNIYAQPSEPIYDVLYASQDEIIAVLGTHEARNVVRYSLKDKAETSLLKADGNIEIIDITKE